MGEVDLGYVVFDLVDGFDDYFDFGVMVIDGDWIVFIGRGLEIV